MQVLLELVNLPLQWSTIKRIRWTLHQRKDGQLRLVRPTLPIGSLF